MAGRGSGDGPGDLDHAPAAGLPGPGRRGPAVVGLTFARYEVLMLLSFSTQGALPLGKIGERLQVNAASVTNAVDRLEARRASSLAGPTPTTGGAPWPGFPTAGRRTAAEATAAMNDALFSDLGIDASNARLLFDLLADLRRAAGDFD